MPSAVPPEVSVAEARLTRLPVAAGPLGSVPLSRARVAVVLAVYCASVPTSPVAVIDPPVGPVTSSETLTTLALETVLFDQAGRVAALTLFDFADLPQGARRVRQFDVAGIACTDVAQVLINGVAACTGDTTTPTTCAQALRVTGSVDDVEVLQ